MRKKMPFSYGESFCGRRSGSAGGQRVSCQRAAPRRGGRRAGWRRRRARTGPMIVDCQWKRSSPIGPAEQDTGGSFCRSCSSLLIRLVAEPIASCSVDCLV